MAWTAASEWRLVLGEDGVQLLAGVVQDLDGGRNLLRRAVLADLEDHGHELADRLAVAAAARVALGRVLPGSGLVGGLGDGGLAGIGEAEDLLARSLFACDKTLVSEELERGVDRTRGRAPGAAAACGELLDHLVAVHRLLGEQAKNGSADVASAGASAGAAEAHRAHA